MEQALQADSALLGDQIASPWMVRKVTRHDAKGRYVLSIQIGKDKKYWKLRNDKLDAAIKFGFYMRI